MRGGLVRPGLCRRVGVTTHAQSEEELINGDSTVCRVEGCDLEVKMNLLVAVLENLEVKRIRTFISFQ